MLHQKHGQGPRAKLRLPLAVCKYGMVAVIDEHLVRRVLRPFNALHGLGPIGLSFFTPRELMFVGDRTAIYLRTQDLI